MIRGAGIGARALLEFRPVPPFPVIELRTARTSDHPWVFRKMIARADPRARPGDRVRVLDRSGAEIGQALFNPRSQIALRMLTDRPSPPLEDTWLAGRLAAADSLRRKTLGLEAVTDAYRVVYSEADGLSGLVVDRLGGSLSVELFSLGMQAWLPGILAGLKALYPGFPIHVRLDKRSAELEGMSPLPAAAAPRPSEVREHGLAFEADLGEGHKTGFFCDQRDNRQALLPFVKGRRVLDAFCHTGAFGIFAAAKGGAAAVTSVDLDEKALAIAQRNAKRNGAEVAFQQADMFDFLRGAAGAGRKWEVIVLDPAKFARGEKGVESALRSYEDINRLALGVLEPGGILLTCSCSGAVSEEAFGAAVHRAALQAGRRLQVLMWRGAAPDHPVALHCPETAYLKALFCRAD